MKRLYLIVAICIYSTTSIYSQSLFNTLKDAGSKIIDKTILDPTIRQMGGDPNSDESKAIKDYAKDAFDPTVSDEKFNKDLDTLVDTMVGQNTDVVDKYIEGKSPTPASSNDNTSSQISNSTETTQGKTVQSDAFKPTWSSSTSSSSDWKKQRDREIDEYYDKEQRKILLYPLLIVAFIIAIAIILNRNNNKDKSIIQNNAHNNKQKPLYSSFSDDINPIYLCEKVKESKPKTADGYYLVSNIRFFLDALEYANKNIDKLDGSLFGECLVILKHLSEHVKIYSMVFSPVISDQMTQISMTCDLLYTSIKKHEEKDYTLLMSILKSKLDTFYMMTDFSILDYNNIQTKYGELGLKTLKNQNAKEDSSVNNQSARIEPSIEEIKHYQYQFFKPGKLSVNYLKNLAGSTSKTAPKRTTITILEILFYIFTTGYKTIDKTLLKLALTMSRQLNTTDYNKSDNDIMSICKDCELFIKNLLTKSNKDNDALGKSITISAYKVLHRGY